MSRASVTIDRTSLGKPDLVIADDSSTLRFTEDGVGYVVQSVRVTLAPDSADVDGSEPLAFAREATGLPLKFHIFGATAAEVAATVAEVEEALYRLSYPVTRTVDGISRTWDGGPCALAPERGAVDAYVAAAHFDTFATTVPFYNPNGA